jgi:hypothetical protein
MSTSDLTWTNIRVKLGDLKPWANNPRKSSLKQAKRILESFDEFGQVETIAVSPGLDVYDGHQRLSALLRVHGKNYEVDARQASRALTDEERKRLVVLLHAGAVGAWDWDTLSSWDDTLLKKAGLDDDFLKQLNTDGAAIKALLGSLEQENEVVDSSIPESFLIVIECLDESNQVELLERLGAEGIKCRALIS